MKLYCMQMGHVQPDGAGGAKATDRFSTVGYATSKTEAVRRAKAIHKLSTYPQGGWRVSEADVPNRLSTSEWVDVLNADALMFSSAEEIPCTITDLATVGKIVAESTRNTTKKGVK